MRFVFYFFLLLTLNPAYCQLDTANIFLFGSDENHSAVKILKSNDNHFYLVGNSGSFTRERSNITILKTDSNLNLIWSKSFNFGSVSNATSSDTLMGNMVVVGGFLRNISNPQYTGLVFCIDSSGALQWKIELNNYNSSFVNSIVVNQNTVFFGGEHHLTNHNRVGFLAYTNHLGEQSTNLIEYPDNFAQIIKKDDTLFAVSISYPKIDSTSLMIWKLLNKSILDTFAFNHSSILKINKMIYSGDSLITLVGSTKQRNNDIIGNNFIWHFFDAFSRNSFFEYGQLNDNNEVVDIAKLSNGNFIYTAEESGIGSGGKGIQIYEMAPPFNLFSAPTFGGELDEFGGKLLVDSKWIYVFGNSESYNSEYFDFYLIRIPNTGVRLEYKLQIKRQDLIEDLIEIPSNSATLSSNINFEIYFNSGLVYIKNIPEESSFYIYSINGQLLNSIDLDQNDAIINLDYLSSGIYLAKIIGNKGFTSALKFVKIE